MKILSAFMIGAVLVALTGTIFAQDSAYIPEDNEELYGTWINMEYRAFPFPKLINYPGDWAAFLSAKSKKVHETGKYTITDKWTDSEGNIWYKTRVSGVVQKVYQLDKISNSGKTWEFVFSYEKYPTEINPKDADYYIYHRE